jgi:hypothetical protein
MTVDEPLPPAVRVGLWGAPESGKTTFLASLFLAAAQLGSDRVTGSPITVTAKDLPSKQFMELYSTALDSNRQFPEATFTSSDPFEWRFTGDLRGTRFAPRHWYTRRRHVPLDFRLQLRDHPGRAFKVPVSGRAIAVNAETRAAGRIDLIGELADCHGLIYLFDPLREAHKEGSYEYFMGVLQQLKQRLDGEGRLQDRKLPQRLAVCITKFDDKLTFTQASKLSGMVAVDRATRQPCIPEKDTERYFKWVCENTRGTAEVVRDAIIRNFLPGHIRYYAVSSVGFFPGSHGGGLDLDDPSNVQSDGALNTIRGRVRPLNVLEPIIDLERTLRVGQP